MFDKKLNDIDISSTSSIWAGLREVYKDWVSFDIMQVADNFFRLSAGIKELATYKVSLGIYTVLQILDCFDNKLSIRYDYNWAITNFDIGFISTNPSDPWVVMLINFNEWGWPENREPSECSIQIKLQPSKNLDTDQNAIITKILNSDVSYSFDNTSPDRADWKAFYKAIIEYTEKLNK